MRFEGLETECKRVNLPAFIVITVSFTVLDGLLTLALSTGSGLDIVFARLLSVAITLPCLAYTLNRLQRAAPVGGVLLMIVSVISTCVSFGVFALIISRNPFVQWPIAFIAASFGGLALAVTGYLRARKRLGRGL
ncbi:hypothetical protein RRU01S_12_00140 [Agrobacterium rubi TR3 = NBRC 13261]|uniref:Uncharacterized protein n=1 Tax=Agrobacterium rubi TR3 = NBRC 13261 TaxID=1368415 RepID=A0A081CUT5_9HYPH|nr:hypothetical protein [Agrobacterium rubi]MBP1879286.1 intracellular septation protein A [Agrobacterium rubi]MCL6652583.1 hypothetical protein [Agrobacterium rubi]GAK70431.1 hypothetical protein RRU01S_12_00140 [Agrobacterium rubi TR3 = NBRC 13261]